MKVNGVKIDDTYAEAFPVYVARVLITGTTTALAETAATVATDLPLQSSAAAPKRELIAM